MFSELMAETPFEVQFRVRGTFIDVAPCPQNLPPRTRSGSLPARTNALRDNEESSERLSSWVERAKCLHRSHVTSPQFASSEESQNLQNEVCSCGATFVPQGRFCWQCGSGKCSTPLSSGITSSIVSRLHKKKNNSEAGRSESKRSDSCETAYSSETLESCPETSASTLGSQPQCDGTAVWADMVDNMDDGNETSWSWNSAEAPTPIASDISAPTASLQWPTSQESSDEDITTLMICDIPCQQTIQQVAGAIDDLEFADTYDLIYLPAHKGRKDTRSIGYAFVNFRHPTFAAEFARVFQNYSFKSYGSTKLSYTKPAVLQGFKANFEKLSKHRNSRRLLTFTDRVALLPEQLSPQVLAV